nr:helix-hairpin-helix domain-containing protein [Saprospiraceae bacterium]
MKRLLQTIYYYTRTERIGILVLCFLSLAVLFLPRLFPLIRHPVTYDFTDFQAQITALQGAAEPASVQVERFPFDPNEIDLEAWQRLGVSRKVAQTILNFRNKGGHFYQKEDLQKIYGLSTSMYDSLASFVSI